jgi:hypothetical protein
MKLKLQRIHYTQKSTCGELTIDDSREIFCHTLELPVKDGLLGSAIPPGTYAIELAPSPKFLLSNDPWVQKYASRMPHVVGIPKRSLIMIHWGNAAHETDGCILVGFTHDLDVVGESRKAFEALFETIETAARARECSIEIMGGATSAPDSALDEADA